MPLQIKHKLFAAMILANLMVIGGIFILISSSFSSSFREYLDANRLEKLSPMAEELAQLYSERQSWQWLRGRRNESWRMLMEQYVFEGQQPPFRPSSQRGQHSPRESARHSDSRDKRPPRSGQKRPPRPPEGRPPPLPPELKVFLADSNGDLIVGRVHQGEEIAWLDIKLNQQVIGTLGFVKTQEITSELDRLFVNKLSDNLIITLVLVIVLSAVIALILARLLVAPILRLRTATSKITHGELDTQLKVHSNDEVGQLSRDFNLLANTLKNNLESRQRWIADISHELRTPVAILQGEIEALHDGIREFNQSSVESLYQEVKRLSLLINDLHELSLSDSGAMTYQFEQLDIVAIVDKAIELNREKIARCKITVEHCKPESPIFVSGDHHRLLQLFLNLLNNSLAYTAAQGVIGIRYQNVGTNVEIEWYDSEPGVDDQALELLFERLYRVDSSRSRNTGGSGLGLSIVKSIVDAHRGSIVATHSELGGVKMKLTLPLNS